MSDNPVVDIPSGEIAMQNCEENEEDFVGQDEDLDDEDEVLGADASVTGIQINKEF